MRITRVYTKTGDQGTTRLVGGQQVRKDDVRIDAYGDVDELNAVLGIVRLELGRIAAPPDVRDRLDGALHGVQNDLFNLGSDLATRTGDRWAGMRRVHAGDVGRLEGLIDGMNDELPPLEEFILPGGGAVSSFLHLARTVCRRAERRTVTLAAGESINPDAVIYLNRLSDWLFVAGRWICRKTDGAEMLWDRTR